MQIPVSAKNANGMSFLPEQRRDRDHQREERDRDHRVERHPVAVDPAEDRPARHPAVARERVPGPRGAGQPGRSAEDLADRGDHDHQLRRPGVEGAGEDRDREAGGVVDRLHVVGREQEREQHEPADHRRPEDRPPDALRGGRSPRRGSPRRCAPRRRSRSACTSSAGSRSAAPGTRSRGCWSSRRGSRSC